MNTSVEREIEAYNTIQAQVSGKVILEWDFTLFCAPGVMPPTNRVTRCFGSVIRQLKASSVLDLGCGSGVLALIATRYAREVIGVDIDPRAVACAKYNARLNNIKNVRFLLGDGYSPVGKQMFDLIISNPPFYPANEIAQPPASMCIKTENALLYSLIKGIRQNLNPWGKVFFVTSSLSDNVRVRKLLQNCDLNFYWQLLHNGQDISQDIYLWKVELSK